MLNIDLESCKVAAHIFGHLDAKGIPIGRSDPMIAAIAITNNLTLITGNTKHYQRIVDLGYPLKLENWRE